MANITNPGARADPSASSAGSETSTRRVDRILLRPLARALLAAAAEIHVARWDGGLAADRTRPADRRPAGQACSFARSPGRHSGRQLAASPDATGPGSAKSQHTPAGGLPVVDSDSLGSSS